MQLLKNEIREKILNVGKKHFGETGFEKTSMKNIAKDAGISIGNIYRYFVTKEHLFSEIISDLEIEMREFCESIPLKSNNDNRIFQLLVDKMVDISERKGQELRVLFRCSEQKQFLEFRERLITMFGERLKLIIENADTIESAKVNHNDFMCIAVARSMFEGISYLVKENVSGNNNQLRKNLNIYVKTMVVDIEKRFLGVMKSA